MRKHILPVLLVIAVLLVAAISCKNNPSPTPTPTPTRPATLSAGYYTKYYEKTTGTSSSPTGTLYYTSPEGTITTLSFTSEGVTSNFDSTVAGNDKTLKLSYKGIDCVVTYNVVEKANVSVAGSYMLYDKNRATFFEGENYVAVEEFSNWFEFLDDNSHDYRGYDYSTFVSSSNGETWISLTVGTGEDAKTFKLAPDGKGGLHKRLVSDLFQPNLYKADKKNYYISTEKASSYTCDNHPGRWLIVNFTEPATPGVYDTGAMHMWFVTDSVYKAKGLDTPTAAEIEEAIADPSTTNITVTGDHIQMYEYGVEIPKFNLVYEGGTKTDKNFYMREARTETYLSIVSSSDENYKGYSYALKPVTP